jgi:hypothetical protein
MMWSCVGFRARIIAEQKLLNKKLSQINLQQVFWILADR